MAAARARVRVAFESNDLLFYLETKGGFMNAESKVLHEEVRYTVNGDVYSVFHVLITLGDSSFVRRFIVFPKKKGKKGAR